MSQLPIKEGGSRAYPIILIVDDEPAILKLLEVLIKRNGFECICADNALHALDIIKDKEIDILVSDINMPEMDGMELISMIKGRYDIDIIMMTGFVKDFSYEEIIERGASDFIQKPLRTIEFISRLKRVIRERLTRIERNQAISELEVNIRKLQHAIDGTIQAITLIVELRDPYTAGHQERVADIACQVAEAMNLHSDVIYGLKMAAKIHDLGKITVPSEILSKPGHLSEIEYALIQKHVQDGYEILKKIEFPWPIADIIHQHHERLDGSGYPNGIKNKEILLEAKIIAVADVFETIISHRPYRPSKGIEIATNTLLENRGKLYDETVVDILLNLIEKDRLRFDKE